MLSSGFTNAPVSQFLLFSLVTSSILASVTDTKYLFQIQVVPHLWKYKQFWRVLLYQTCYTNSTSLLFSSIILYNLRIIERLWGPRKFASFLISTIPYTAVLPPLILGLVLRPLSLNSLNFLPAGPTPLVFALLAQYHAAIPHVYKYRLVTSSTTTTAGHTPSGILLTDKSTTYLLAFQLAFSQFPGSLVSAATGWLIGYAWRSEILPGGVARWRVPGWGRLEKREGRQGYEGLRRRLEGEGERGMASGVEMEGEGGADAGAGPQRRTLGNQILDRFRGNY